MNITVRMVTAVTIAVETVVIETLDTATIVIAASAVV